jgi:hypothetical protein
MKNHTSWSRQARSAAIAVLLPMLAGCGSNGHQNPMAPSPPSTKSGTMVVIADAASNPDGSGNTLFTVSVADTGTGAAVSGATVEFSTPSGTVSLSEDSGTPGTYRAQSSGHVSGLYVLSVVRNLDVATASIDMPDAHVITSPAANDVISSSNSLDVTWTRSAASQEAWVDTKDWNAGTQTDNGSGRIPRPHNDPRADQRVSVTRRNSDNPASMAAGSVIRASVRVSVEPIVVQ